MNTNFSFLACLPVVALLAACSGTSDVNPASSSGASGSSSGGSSGAASSSGGSSSGGSSSGGSSSGGSSSGSSSGSAAMCNSVTQQGAVVKDVARPNDDAPVATGGAVADGTYVLTAINVYGANASLGLNLQITLEKTGNTLNTVSLQNGKEERRTATLMLAGTKATVVPTCRFPDPGTGANPETAEYSVTRNEYRVLAQLGRATLEQVYTRK